MILWAAAIAVVTALPFPYVLGYFFHRKIYEKNLQKFDVMKEDALDIYNKSASNLSEKDKSTDY